MLLNFGSNFPTIPCFEETVLKERCMSDYVRTDEYFKIVRYIIM